MPFFSMGGQVSLFRQKGCAIELEQVRREPLRANNQVRQPLRLEIVTHACLQVEIGRDRPRPERLDLSLFKLALVRQVFELGLDPELVDIPANPGIAIKQDDVFIIARLHLEPFSLNVG